MNKFLVGCCIGSMLTLSGVPCHAQSWFPDEAEWHFFHQYGAGPGIGYIHISVGGDTILQGVTARKLSKTRTIADASTPPYTPYTEGTGITVVAEVDGLVMIHNADLAAFDTLYDMNALPGDSWRFADWPDLWNCSASSYTQVVDTGTMLIDGVPLRWLAVEQHMILSFEDPPFDQVVQDTIVERIGALNDYLFPHDRCFGMTDGNEGGPLRCYSDANISYNAGVVGWYTYSSACDFLPNAIPEIPASGFRIFSLPGHDRIGFELASVSIHPSATIELLDGHGRMLRREVLRSTTITWDVHDLDPGMYVVRLLNGVDQFTAKWVKE